MQQKKGIVMVTILVGWALASLAGCARQQDLHKIALDDTDELHQFFELTSEARPIISGHRGGAKNGYPENSIASMEYTLSHTPATFELDPRITKDSIIVLMHDATLDRTTNGTGKVADYTWEQLQQLKLKDPVGNLTDYCIPSLEEAIRWSRGKTVINLDEKDVPKEMTARIIRRHQAEAHVIVTVHTAEEARYYHERNPDLMFSAFIKTEEAFAKYEAAIPWSQVAQAYIGPEYNADKQPLVDKLHRKGVMVMVGAGPSYDKLKPRQRAQAYRDLIRSGIDIIESDRPIEVAEAIDP